MPKNNQPVAINQNAQSFSTNNSYPSPSSQQQSSPSPHHIHAQHRNLSSPHAFSPSSPQQKSQLPLQSTSNVLQQTSSQSQNMNQSQIQTNNCWSNLPPNPNLSTRTSTSIGLNNSINSNVTTGIQKRLQEQQSDPIRNNPILNAQLSQDSVSYIQIHSQNPQQQNSFNSNQQTLPPPSSNSPSLNSSGLSMRFNRNSPVLTNSSQQQTQPNQQYPSPNYLNSNMNSVPSPPIQQPINRNSTANQQRLQPMQGRNINNLNNSLHSPVGLNSSQSFYSSDQNIINSSNQMNIQGPPSSQQQQSGQSIIYSNCVINTTSGAQPNNNISSSEYVKQGLRAKLGARNQQQMGTQTIQNRAQLPLIQQQQQSQLNIQSSQSHLSHIQQQPNSSTVRHLQQPQQTINTSPPNLSNNSGNLNQPFNQQSQLLSNSPQLNSSLTDEDFDAIGIALSVNNDSSFFDFNNDLPETNAMVGLKLK